MIVFLQRADMLVKIGMTRSLTGYLRGLEATHGELAVLAWKEGDYTLLQQIQFRFLESRVEGEWFKPTRELDRFIKGFAEAGMPPQYDTIPIPMQHDPRRDDRIAVTLQFKPGPDDDLLKWVDNWPKGTRQPQVKALMRQALGLDQFDGDQTRPMQPIHIQDDSALRSYAAALEATNRRLEEMNTGLVLKVELQDDQIAQLRKQMDEWIGHMQQQFNNAFYQTPIDEPIQSVAVIDEATKALRYNNLARASW